MIYFDTSYLVRLYLEDAGWEQVRVLAETEQIGCSVLGRAETLAAFHRKLRESVFTLKDFRDMNRQFELDCEAEAFVWFPLAPIVFQKLAGSYTDLPVTLTLHAADAIHLATAAVNGLKEIYSTDRQLLAAAGNFDVKGVNVI